eukprot:6209892-Pleurochrysis_carterae.AAC.1
MAHRPVPVSAAHTGFNKKDKRQAPQLRRLARTIRREGLAAEYLEANCRMSSPTGSGARKRPATSRMTRSSTQADLAIAILQSFARPALRQGPQQQTTRRERTDQE